MSGIQSIINMTETIDVNRRKVLGIQYSRSEVARISETVTRNPWKFTLTVPAMMEYSECRDLLEEIDFLDARYPQTVSFSTATGASATLDYMFRYRGDLSASQLSSITVDSWTGTQLVLANLPTVSPTDYVLRKGDFIQVQGYTYPTTSLFDVPRGSDSTVTVNTHRPNFMGTVTNNRHLVVGNAVEFRVFVNNMPTYKITAGGTEALVTWSGAFNLYEFTGDI